MCLILEEKEKRREEEFALWEECRLIDENWLTTPIKFAAGAAGNLVSQTARGLGNISRGAAGDFISAGEMGLGALQVLGGGKKKGWERMKKGWQAAEDSGYRMGRGAAQAIGAISGVTPMLRGAQAASEPFFSLKGTYAPSGVEKGSFSDLFGMGSWEDKKSEPERREEDRKPPPTTRSHQKRKWSGDGPEPNEECKRLIMLYKSTREPEARKKIQRRMEIVDPKWYKHALTKARARSKP